MARRVLLMFQDHEVHMMAGIKTKKENFLPLFSMDEGECPGSPQMTTEGQRVTYDMQRRKDFQESSKFQSRTLFENK